MAEGGQVAVQVDDEVVAASRIRELEARARSGAAAGTQDAGVEVLKEALAVAWVKKSRVGGRPLSRPHSG